MDGGGSQLRALADKKQPAQRSVRRTRFEEGKSLSRRQLFARRFFHRAEARVETLPRFFSAIMSASVVGGFSLYGMVLGGYFNEAASHTTASIGFDVDAVTITGHRFMRERDILDVLGLAPGVSLVTFNVAAAHQTLLREPWVESASVRKVYPDKLQINLEERQPFAVWQRGQIKSIIDSEGLVLDDFDADVYQGLPFLVGHGAQRKGHEFLKTLAEFPEIANRVRATMLRSERRWDILLDNLITVKLPERKVRDALTELVLLESENDILSKDLVSIDMRLPDRLVMRLSDDAMVNRQAVLKRRKEIKTKEKNI
ncbi:MAG: FtsQ-type POTRA domain-containing protein [Hyphomicrobiales bacterium]